MLSFPLFIYFPLQSNHIYTKISKRGSQEKCQKTFLKNPIFFSYFRGLLIHLTSLQPSPILLPFQSVKDQQLLRFRPIHI